MKVFVMVCAFALSAFATELEVEKRKEKKNTWPTNSWKVDTSTGDISVALTSAAGSDHKADLKNEWYDATNSKEHGISSWANLEADGATYLVGSKEHKSGSSLPGPSDKLVVFNVTAGQDPQNFMLKPVQPTASQSLERKKKKKADVVAGAWMWGAYYATWAWAWTWPVWAAAATGQDLEATKSHSHLSKMLHNLEDDVRQLSALEHGKKMSLEKEKKTITPSCAYWGFFPFGAWGCGFYLTPAQ